MSSPTHKTAWPVAPSARNKTSPTYPHLTPSRPCDRLLSIGLVVLAVIYWLAKRTRRTLGQGAAGGGAAGQSVTSAPRIQLKPGFHSALPNTFHAPALRSLALVQSIWSRQFGETGLHPGGTRVKLIISSVNPHTNATRIGWNLWDIDSRLAPGLPPGWLVCSSIDGFVPHIQHANLIIVSHKPRGKY